jgi:PPOX class probable F420-dependent enzyme
MTALTPELTALLDDHHVGVVATAAADGHPRQSVVYYARVDDALVISTLGGRVKADDVRRTGWASLSVRGDEAPYPSATFSGPASIETGDLAATTALIFRRFMPDVEPPTEEQLAEAGRVILRIAIDRVSAVTHLG